MHRELPVGKGLEIWASVVGSLPLSYQWQFKGVGQSTWQDIGGANGSVLAIADVGVAGGGSYRVMAANAFGVGTGTETAVEVLLSGLVAWGKNDFGQTTVPAGLAGVIQVAAGGDRMLALKADGTVVGWGGNPAPSGLGGVVQVAVGGYFDLVLRSDGTVVTWLGAGGWSVSLVPAELSGVVAIAGNWMHSFALKADGTVVVWAAGNPWGVVDAAMEPPAGLANVVAIAAGGNHCLALKSDGSLVAWGHNTDELYYAPSGVPYVGAWSGAAAVPYGLSGAMMIAAGGFHNLVLVGATPPLLVLLGENPMTVLRGSSFGDPGAIARDARGNDLTYTVSGSVDTWRLGTYLLNYSVTADNGRTATATRTANVVSDGTDITPPVLTCLSNMNMPAGPSCEAAIPDFLPTVTAVDDSGGPVTLAQDPAAGISAGLGKHVIAVRATDACGHSTTAYRTLNVQYATAGYTCNGNPGHVVLQPINADGTSVSKQGSTVPVKFQVFDANCNSIGAPGVVSSFVLWKVITGTVVALANEPVDSTTPDTQFRWSAGSTASNGLWIYNIGTKSLAKNKTYVYLITLNDGSTIQFQFGLK